MEEKQDIISNIRAVLISRKGPATVNELNKDYHDLGGTYIPYKKFRFNTLEDFLKSDPTFTLSYHHNETYVAVVPKKESQHISLMIAKQKSPKKKAGSSRMPRALSNPRGRQPRAESRNYAARMGLHGTSRSAQLYSRQPIQTFSSTYQVGKRSYSSSPQHNFVHNQPFQELQRTQIQSSKPLQSVRQIKDKEVPRTNPGMKENSDSRPQSSSKGAVTKQVPLKVCPPVLVQNVKTQPKNMKLAQTSNQKDVKAKQNEEIQDSNIEQTMYSGADMNGTNRRGILNLEPISTRNVSMSNTNGCQNLHVTKHITINEKSRATRTGTQNRLNKFRQNQADNINPNITPIQPIDETIVKTVPIIKSSLQSRLLKYRTQDPIPIPIPEDTSPEEGPSNEESTTDSMVDFTEVSDFQSALLQYCCEHNISTPVVETYQHSITQSKNYKSDRPSLVFGCRIEIGKDFIFGSYSDKYLKPEDATQEACKNALQSLTKRYGSLAERELPITEGRLVPHRMIKLIAGHSNGKFVHQLPVDYREQYRENLPEDWLEFVRMSRLFQIDDSVGGSQIISLRQLQSLAELGAKKDNIDFTDLSPMVLPDKESYWNVFITNVCSTIEIWCRIIGPQYGGLYEELTTYMEQEPAEKKVKAETVSIGAFYSVNVADSWHRVQILEIKDLKVLCFYIDTGEEDWHAKTDIYVLDNKYRYVPPQGILLQLAGLEEYAENLLVLQHLNDCLLNKSLVAEIISSGDEDQTISVILFDTSSNDDVNLNALLKMKIKDEVKAPMLHEKGKINEVYVSHISDKGDVYLQIRNETFKYLHSQIQFVMDIGFDPEDIACSTTLLEENSNEKLFLAIKPEENKCYRILITGPVDKKKVPVYYVDYGYTGFVEVGKLIALHLVSAIIDEFPHQALKVELSGLKKITPGLASRLRGCLPVNGPVLVKVIEANNIPVVEIFMRTQEQLLISVNNALQNEIEIEKTAEEVERLKLEKKTSPKIFRKKYVVTPKQKVEHPKTLPEPDIPTDGKYFPITVTMAASPSNFVIRPYNQNTSNFKKLMDDLQLLCRNIASSPSCHEIEKGNVYAGRHKDGVWYRVQVTNVMKNNNSVTVHFCDFGDYDVMSCKNLQNLTTPFLEVPYNALKARLGGDSSTYQWNVSDCLRFQELVCDKNFVSKVHSIDADELNKTDKILTLTLIDTSSEEDIYITSDFIKAKHKSESEP